MSFLVGADKLLFQSFPVDKLRLSHLTEEASMGLYEQSFFFQKSAGIASVGWKCAGLDYDMIAFLILF